MWLQEARDGLTQPGKYLAYEESGRQVVTPLAQEWTRIGRSLSADRAVQGAARVMPFCFAMGEAAGLAAAMAARGSGRTRDVDIAELQARLRAQGAWLDPA